MKKVVKNMMMLFVIGFLCTGCGHADNEGQANTNVTDENSILYSNLVDSSSQKEVTDILENYGVTKKQTDTFISWVNDFNSRVEDNPLQEGFHIMEGNGMDYNSVIIKNKEAEDGTIFPEANCRLTSYLLMKNRIQTNGKQIDEDTFLIFDVEAIDMYDQFRLNEEEKTNFITLFNWIPVDGTNTFEEHVDKIQEAWADREIKVEGEGISLISVYLHSPFEEVRFVGHTGVLIEKNQELLFIEKYGPLSPFQATKFHNRKELKNYLLSRADLYGDETELEPIIMENNHLIDKLF